MHFQLLSLTVVAFPLLVASTTALWLPDGMKLACMLRGALVFEPRTRHQQLANALVSTFLEVDGRFASLLRPVFELGFSALCRVGCCAIVAAVTDTHVVVANGKLLLPTVPRHSHTLSTAHSLTSGSSAACACSWRLPCDHWPSQ